MDGNCRAWITAPASAYTPTAAISASTASTGCSGISVAPMQATSDTKGPMDRSRSLTARIIICASVANITGIARFNSRLMPK